MIVSVRLSSLRTERGMIMATLIVGLAVLVGATAWASHASEGAWLTFFESAAQPEHRSVEARAQSKGMFRLANPPETKSPVNRIADLPSFQQSRIGVYK
jgi:hypothetical protein